MGGLFDADHGHDPKARQPSDDQWHHAAQGHPKIPTASGFVEGRLAALDHQRVCDRAAGSAGGQCGAACRSALAV
uniref:Oxidoreductase n=1 Tax=Parastrongyloides trichosuri TaxID=131310 RepID=A0A0N4Z1I2_PARTI